MCLGERSRGGFGRPGEGSEQKQPKPEGCCWWWWGWGIEAVLSRGWTFRFCPAGGSGKSILPLRDGVRLFKGGCGCYLFIYLDVFFRPKLVLGHPDWGMLGVVGWCSSLRDLPRGSGLLKHRRGVDVAPACSTLGMGLSQQHPEHPGPSAREWLHLGESPTLSLLLLQDLPHLLPSVPAHPENAKPSTESRHR